MSPATKSASGASPPAAAGVVLQQMHRRVRWSRLGVWGALAAGPASLVLWSMTPGQSVKASAPTAAATRPAAQPVHDPRGYAEVFVAAWLRSSRDDADGAQAMLAQSMAPSIQLPEPGPGARAAQSVAAVRSVQRSKGRWSVTVAAQDSDGTVRYFAVTVVAGSDGGAFAVERAPGRVGTPGVAQVPESAYRVEVPGEGELQATVSEFLRAYLAGVGQVEPYLAPGVRLRAVAAAPYDEVEVDEAAADSEQAATEVMPAEGTRVRIAVQVTAKDADGVWPLAYELVMAVRAGRWEVAALVSSADAQGGGGRS